MNTAATLDLVVTSRSMDPWSPTDEHLKALFPPDGEPPGDMPESVRKEIMEAGPGSSVWCRWYGGTPAGGAQADEKPVM